jgi:hypothetical protein
MITFDRINRRTHLYLGLILIPWVMMYGISSFIISHRAWFQSKTEPAWKPMFEREYNHPIPAQGDLRAIATEILRENDLEGAFYAQRPSAGELRINRNTFFDQTRLTYLINEHRLRAERQEMPWDQAILRMHFRSGYNQPSFLNLLWAIMVDVACVAILLWIASGLLMWWRVSRTRVWGACAIGAGVLSFVLLVWKL